MLPRDVRWSAQAIYAYCRAADDEIDLSGQPKLAYTALTARLDRICSMSPGLQPHERAFAEVMQKFAIPAEVPRTLLEGFLWDVEGRRYQSLDDLVKYGVRVASTVGVMMSLIMGTRSAQALARAADLGIAMQLTNIARDVGEDAALGRIYLPIQWLKDESIDPDEWLKNPLFSAPLSRVTARLLAAADQFYSRSMAGIPLLPSASRTAIFSAASIYADIGRVIQSNDYDSVNSRAFTSKGRKLWLMTKGRVEAKRLREQAATPAAPAAERLISAVTNYRLPEPEPPPRPWWNLSRAVGDAAVLFAELNERDREDDRTFKAVR